MAGVTSTTRQFATPGGGGYQPGSAGNGFYQFPQPGAYGSVPAPQSPQASQAASIGGNLSNLAQLYQLSQGAGAASGAGAAAGLNAALPGATDALGNALKVSTGEVNGQLPPDVLSQIMQTGAERGISTGTFGSGDNNAALLQALGLNSLQLSNTGMSNLEGVIGATPRGPAFNPASMLVDPASQLEQSNYNADLAAAPNPTAAAMANLGALNAGRGGAGGAGPAGGASLPDTGSGYGPSLVGTATGTANTYGNTSDLVAGPANDYGAAAFQNDFGTGLPDGANYDPSTGLLFDEEGNIMQLD